MTIYTKYTNLKHLKLFYIVLFIFNFKIIQSSCCKGDRGGCCCCKGNSNNNGNVSSDTKLINPNKNIINNLKNSKIQSKISHDKLNTEKKLDTKK